MILSGLISMLGGGLLRQVPELLKFFDKKGERDHELKMLDKQFALDKLHAEQGLQLAQVQAASARDTGETEIWKAALEAQGRPTGIAWIDGLTSFVRPFLTLYWCVFLYSAVKVAQFVVMTRGGLDTAATILAMWSPADMELVMSMIGFWFADRSIAKGHSVTK